jgi:hypothetical protein
VSPPGFEKLRDLDLRPERIRRLPGELTIPIQIPSSSERLLAATPPWEDGPHAVTTIRNSVTHSYESSGSPPVFEAWQLAQSYLELALLRLFEFKGSYSNRTKQGKYIGEVRAMEDMMAGAPRHNEKEPPAPQFRQNSAFTRVSIFVCNVRRLQPYQLFKRMCPAG